MNEIKDASKDMPPIPYDEFQWNTVAKSGGLSGSVSIDDSQGQKYQYKFSVLRKKFWGQTQDHIKSHIKGRTDHENVGELIAGELASSLKDAMGNNLASPEISFVAPDPNAKSKDDRKSVNIVSKYMPNFKDMEGFFRQYTGYPKKKKIRYLKIDFNRKQNNSDITKKTKPGGKVVRTAILGAEDMPQEMKQGISDGVAMNVLFGNIDVNAKGNMGVQLDPKTGEKNVAILDFGHAFNNLITQVTTMQHFSHGGGLRHENGVLDFLNREKILGGKPKLWRDYDGLIPSEFFVESLTKMSKSQGQMLEGLQNAMQKIQSLSNTMEDKSMLKASLERLNKNIGIEQIESKNVDELIKETMTNMQGFISQRQEEMKEVAQIMDLQLKIDAHIKENPRETRIPREFATAYDKLKQNSEGKITWVKSDKNKPAKEGNLAEYMAERRAEIGKAATKAKADTKSPKRGGWAKQFSKASSRVTSWAKHFANRKSSRKSQDKGVSSSR